MRQTEQLQLCNLSQVPEPVFHRHFRTQLQMSGLLNCLYPDTGQQHQKEQRLPAHCCSKRLCRTWSLLLHRLMSYRSIHSRLFCHLTQGFCYPSQFLQIQHQRQGFQQKQMRDQRQIQSSFRFHPDNPSAQSL